MASFGDLLKEWRQRRRLSQLDLACEAGVSQRHVSFVESGRTAPSRDMVLHLADHLDIPLRERNALLLAAGFAPVFPHGRLDDPGLKPVRQAMETVLRAHEPMPALAVDRHWTLVAANRMVPSLMAGVTDPVLLEPPVNVLRLCLHPNGMAPQIANLADWRVHILERLRRQVMINRDPVLVRLTEELASYPAEGTALVPDGAVAVPLELDTAAGRLSLISTTMVFGTAMDVTVAELAVEAFFPADEVTLERLRALAGG